MHCSVVSFAYFVMVVIAAFLVCDYSRLWSYPVDTTRTWFTSASVSCGWLAGDVTVDKIRCSDKGSMALSVPGVSLGVECGLTYRPAGHFFLGYEVAGAWHDARGAFSLAHIPYTKIEIKHTHTYGAYAYVGHTCLTMNPFVRLGLVRGQHESFSQSKAFVYEEEGYGEKRLWRSGFDVALGVDICVAQGILVGGILSHTRYEGFSFQTSGETPKALYHVKPRTSLAQFRLRVLF